MKLTRAILLLLCSLVLPLSPAVSDSAGAGIAARSDACRCANCRCCVESPAPDAPATPAVPASSTTSGKRLAWLPGSFSFVPTSSEPTSFTATPPGLPCRSLSIPLYQRDCAYVI